MNYFRRSARDLVRGLFGPTFVSRHPETTRHSVKQLERAMWAGFGNSVATALEAIKCHAINRGELDDVARVLAHWYFSIGNYQRFLDNVTTGLSISSRECSDPRCYALIVEALLQLGRIEEANQSIQDALLHWPESPELWLSAANAMAYSHSLPQSEVNCLRLVWISKALRGGFAPLAAKDPDRPLALDNICAPAATMDPRSDAAKISVLMPAYNCGSTVATAIESVLNQTWRNLELVVVDDGSNDNTWSVIQYFTTRDSRVIGIRQEANLGAYAARNSALRHATGDFVTVHDADDWSHPERLAFQVLSLLESGETANTTGMIRVDASLSVKLAPPGRIIPENTSSLLLTRNNIIELGGWDECNFAADSELYRRLLAKHKIKKNILQPDIPLTVSLLKENSLTGRRISGSTSYAYGARRQYREASQYWHRLEGMKTQPDFALHPGKRAFPVPNVCLLGSRRDLEYDLLLVSDFSLSGGTMATNVNTLWAASLLKLRCACFHWPLLRSADRDVHIKIRELLHQEMAASVVSGERVRCRVALVCHPPSLTNLPDELLEVTTRVCIITVNEASLTSLRASNAYQNNVRTVFGVRPLLAPMSPAMRLKLLSIPKKNQNLTALDWTPLINLEQWAPRHRSWDGSRSPVVGRHGRDAKNKWPSDPIALRSAYCVNLPVAVRLLGGAKHAQRMLGFTPHNWSVLPFDSMEVSQFLAGLDFLLYYPHQDASPHLSYPPLEAMAVGIPVLVPPAMRGVYGDGAIYANSADVFSTLHAFWRDRSLYEAQVKRGLDFVTRACSAARLEDRIRPYLEPVS